MRPSSEHFREAWNVVARATAFPSSYVELCRRFLKQWGVVR